MTHVLKIATSNHHPFDTRIFEKEAKTLVKNGFRVSILIPWEEDLTKEGIDIISVRKPASGWEKLFITPFIILAKALNVKNVDVIHIHDSELLLAGLLLKLAGKMIIYDAHEDSPLQIQYQHWIPKLLKPFFKYWYYWLEKIAGLTFHGIIVAVPSIEKYYPNSKCHLVRNFPLISNDVPLPPWRSRKDQVAYIGSITRARGIGEMLEAFTKARKSKNNIRFVLGGKFSPDELVSILDEYKGINYLKWLSLKEVFEILSVSKIGLIVPHPVDSYKTNYPVKMFEYMLAGIPVIASNAGVFAEFVKESNCGMLVDPMDVNSIANAILFLLNNEDEAEIMGIRGRDIVIEKYNWKNEERELLALYQKLGMPIS